MIIHKSRFFDMSNLDLMITEQIFVNLRDAFIVSIQAKEIRFEISYCFEENL